MERASTRPWAPWSLAFCAWLLALVSNVAQAQAPLALEGLRGEQDLGAHVQVLRDAKHELTFTDVRATGAAFVPNRGRSLSLGFDYDPLWLRFSARNDSDQAVHWLLEVAEPTLDYVDLYAVHGNGLTEVVHTGDRRAFDSRPVGHANFVFEMHTEPHDGVDYFLRVQSDDVLRAPVRAWTPRAYASHHEREIFLQYWAFGALLVVALYHLGVFVLVRRAENLWYALVSLSLCAVLVALGGLCSVFLFPEQPALANRMPALSIAVAMSTVAFFTHATMHTLGTVSNLARVLWRIALSTFALIVLASFGPTWLALQVECVILLALTLSGPLLLRIVHYYEIPELRLYSVGWYGLIVSIPIAILRYGGVWPDTLASRWALPAGFIVYGVLNSLALASLASQLRRELAEMNDKLIQNVRELQQALVHAEEANEKAQRATKAKDEFMATMSHELRTPLNTIINIPQGLVNEFEALRSARCGHCGASFLLDEADRIDGDTECLDCAQRGTLVEGTKIKFRGDDARCLTFLHKIERSGQHLLQMVNGVLDFSKMEAGRFQLELGPVDLESTLHEVREQMLEIAQGKQIALYVDLAQGPRAPLTADVLRIKQVLINLVANAIKFSDARTSVHLRWSSLSDCEQIEVEDRGIGIAPADHERVFTSFEQVHKGDTRKYGGTGLGLSISRSLVRMHGGELSVKSELGQGATFIVRLPHAPSSPQRSLAESQEISREPRALASVRSAW